MDTGGDTYFYLQVAALVLFMVVIFRYIFGDNLMSGAGMNNEPNNPALLKVTDTVYFDIAVQSQSKSKESESLGRIRINLFGDTVPKTVANFKHLCIGDKDGLTYKQSPFHRIIPGFMIQGGDITHGDGRGGCSIYGRTFNDENFALRHCEAGYLSMANAGRNTNGSQFFITTVPTGWLNGKHVVFGQVADEDSMRIVKTLESYGSSAGSTKAYLYIADCGVEST